MDRRDFIRHTAAGTLLGGTVWPALAQGGFVEGRHYVRLKQPLQVSAPAGKIEVIEFFWYGCPHCYAFEPTLDAWIRKLPTDVAFRRVHVGFRTSFEPQQRLHVALETMGLMDTIHRKIFNAIHQDHLPLTQPDQIIEFVARNGVDKTKFTEVYNSFGVQSKARQGRQLAETYGINGVPALGIHGRFHTSPGQAAGENAPEDVGQRSALQLVDQLVGQIRKSG